MAYYLYIIGGYNEKADAKSLTSEGLTAIVEHNTTAGTTGKNISGMVIDTPGNPYDGSSPGVLAANVGIALPQNPFHRVNTGAGAYAGGYNYHGLIIGDTEVSSPSTWDSELDNGGKEVDWKGLFGTATYHTPSLDSDTYTLIVPTDNVVYQSGVQRVGCVLVWHIPYNELGVYAQNANLASAGDPVIAADTDAKAAGKIWAMGYGLISEFGTSLPFIQIA